MEFPITKEEVVKHLEDLGYKNISDEKVDQFIQDLKRLIKYEEKKSRRKLKESQHRRGRPVSSRQEESVVSFTRSASLVSSYEGTSLSLSESASASTTTRSSTSSEYNKVSNVSLKRNRDVQVVIDVHPVKTKKDTVDSGTILNDDTTRLRQILPPRVQMPTKPTVGFIKPREINTGLSKKSDPVSLYQHYKKIWDAKTFPGDGSDKNLRWSVREWMIGGKQS